MDWVEACRKLIAIDSTPDVGNWRAAEMVAALARELGLYVEIQEEATGDLRQANVIARLQETIPSEELLFETHLDTPDPGPFGLWTKTDLNPFEAHIIENRIYGLGAADAKLDFLCKMRAMVESGASGSYRVPPVLVGTFGEETDMSGAMKLIRKQKVRAKKALIGEPTNLRLIGAGKGFARVEIYIPFEDDERKFRIEHNVIEGTSTQSKIFHGKASHSSTPQLGESAIQKMFEYLLQMPEGLALMEVDGGVNFNTVPAQAYLEVDPFSGFREPMSRKLAAVYRAILQLEDKFTRYQDPQFTPATPTLTVGLIRTSEEGVTMSGTCRMSPLISNEVYESWMDYLEQICLKIGGTFRVQSYRRPFQVDTQSAFVKGLCCELRDLGLPDLLGTQSSTNEASLFSRVGIECLSFGAGSREGNIHTPTENVAIEDLRMATEFYKRTIGSFCK